MAHGLSRSVACGIFTDQGSNPCPCIGRQILNHCATREVPQPIISITVTSPDAYTIGVNFRLCRFHLLSVGSRVPGEAGLREQVVCQGALWVQYLYGSKGSRAG